MRSRLPPAVPTLAQLHRETAWLWVYCEGRDCHHQAAMTLAPLVIHWGPDASSDRLRRRARCSGCGALGAMLRLPSWMGSGIGPRVSPG